MANTKTTLFLPEEHRIISTYLGVKPVEDIPDNLTLEKALDNLGLNEEVDIHDVEEYATAAILLGVFRIDYLNGPVLKKVTSHWAGISGIELQRELWN